LSHVRVAGESNVLIALNDCQHLHGREKNAQSGTERATEERKSSSAIDLPATE
jgi:hypothetical protein